MPDESRFNEDWLAFSSSYSRTMEEAVLPWLREHEQDRRIPGGDGKELFCSWFTADHPIGTVLVMHGFTENAFKYSELIFSLLHAGLNVCAYDQRGHGRSWRDGRIDDLSLTHVADFNEYVADMECVCDTFLRDTTLPRLLFCHSMAGAVGGLFLERHPGFFSKALFSSPMIAADRGHVPFFLVKALCRCAKWTGHGKDRIFISKPYGGPEDFATACATGRERFDWYDAIKAAHPEFTNNGSTYDWTLQSMRVSQMLLWPGRVEKIDADVLVYSAAQDTVVLPRAQRMFVRRLKRGRLRVVEGAKHEIYRSSDDVLFPWWHEALAFLTDGAVSGPPAGA